MQAIMTRDLPATNTKPRRIVAQCAAKRMVFSYDTMDGTWEDNHKSAASLLIKALGWEDYGRWYSGQLSTGEWVFVCNPTHQSSYLNIV